MALISSFLKGAGRLLGGATKGLGTAPGNLWKTLNKSGAPSKLGAAREQAAKVADTIKDAAVNGKVATVGLAKNFEKLVSATPGGKAFHAGRREMGPLGQVVRVPMSKLANAPAALQYGTVGAALVGGLGYGVVKSSLNRSNERTMQRQQTGMQHNHLGTDGLTLALSKSRHRR